MLSRVQYTAILLFAATWVGLLFLRLQDPIEQTFSNDATLYNTLAIHLADDFAYSLDGVVPYTAREPGQSIFLGLIYTVFGNENRVAIFTVQAVLYLLASFFFCKEWGKITTKRTTDICFCILLFIPSVYHIIFSAYRESLALSLSLLFITSLFRSYREFSWKWIVIAGVFLGLMILTYASFILLPFFLIPFLLLMKMRWKQIALLIAVTAVVISPWLIRNYRLEGGLCIAGCNRSAVQWYVRGEQVEHLRGLEPYRCLWAEYISRNWDNRSTYCSFNRVMHEQWPDGFTGSAEDAMLGKEGQKKILAHFPNYIWTSISEVLELHLPYVNGWGFIYNALTTLAMVLLYFGCLFSFRSSWKREYLLLLACMLYVTGIFVLTDATPRYLMPVLFSYAAVASLGYSWLMERKRT